MGTRNVLAVGATAPRNQLRLMRPALILLESRCSAHCLLGAFRTTAIVHSSDQQATPRRNQRSPTPLQAQATPVLPAAQIACPRHHGRGCDTDAAIVSSSSSSAAPAPDLPARRCRHCCPASTGKLEPASCCRRGAQLPTCGTPAAAACSWVQHTSSKRRQQRRGQQRQRQHGESPPPVRTVELQGALSAHALSFSSSSSSHLVSSSSHLSPILPDPHAADRPHSGPSGGSACAGCGLVLARAMGPRSMHSAVRGRIPHRLP